MSKVNFVAKTFCFITIICITSICVKGQTDVPVSYITIKPKLPFDKSSWCRIVEQPVFPGGIVAWTQYLSDSTNYPENYGNKRDGVIRMTFIVSKGGYITEVTSLDSVENCFTEEAIRVLKASPKWKPATQNGRAVSYRMVQGFYFIWDPPTKLKMPSCDSTELVPKTFPML